MTNQREGPDDSGKRPELHLVISEHPGDWNRGTFEIIKTKFIQARRRRSRFRPITDYLLAAIISTYLLIQMLIALNALYTQNTTMIVQLEAFAEKVIFFVVGWAVGRGLTRSRRPDERDDEDDEE